MRSQANLAACGLCRYELPFAAKWMIDAHKVDAVIAVGYSPPTLISRLQPPSSRFSDRHFAGFPRVCALSIRTCEERR